MATFVSKLHVHVKPEYVIVGNTANHFVNSESLDFPCYCAAQLAELAEYFFTKICAVMGEGGHLQQRG